MADDDLRAFPRSGATPEIYSGMTLRDYFAAHALQGILAGGFAGTVPHDDVGAGDQAAAFAYMYADALLKER